MSWPVAIALGAIVAPPDAAAATAVMRQVKLPHKLLKIIEGESLLNDASALLVYRLAIMAVMAGPSASPASRRCSADRLRQPRGRRGLRVRAASADDRGARSAGRADHAVRPDLRRLDRGRGDRALGHPHAGRLRHDGRRSGGAQLPARQRVPVFAVWEAVVFVLNAFAFVLIGMQLRPIWRRLEAGGARTDAVLTALVVLVTTIAARFVWVLSYKALTRRRLPPPRSAAGAADGGQRHRAVMGRHARHRYAGRRLRDSRDPARRQPFPHRDLILLCAFAVVLGTLVLQGLTMAPLIRRLGLSDDDPVGREIRLGRTQAYARCSTRSRTTTRWPASCCARSTARSSS